METKQEIIVDGKKYWISYEEWLLLRRALGYKDEDKRRNTKDV